MRGIVRASLRMVAAFGILIGTLTSPQAAGAVAVGECGAYGYAYDYANMTDARSTALSRCKGKKCRVVATMARSCAGFAVDLKNVCGAHGWATARRLGEAQNAALRECYKHGGSECVIRGFLCDAKG